MKQKSIRTLTPQQAQAAVDRLKSVGTLLPVDRAAQLVYGPTLFGRLLWTLRKVWLQIDTWFHAPVHAIEDATQGKLVIPESSMRDYLDKCRADIFHPEFGVSLPTYNLGGDLRLDPAVLIEILQPR
jgi:hypothetical protein